MREGLDVRKLAAVICGRNIWKKDRSASGLSWQARRIAGSEPAPTRLSTNASRLDGSGSDVQSPMMRIRQVEQRARPPHTLACGTLLRRLASSTLRPFGTRTVLPLPYERVIMPPRRSFNARAPLASKTRPSRPRYPIRKYSSMLASTACSTGVPTWRGEMVERFHPQPEVKSDAAVDPGNDHDSIHQPYFVRPHDPVRKKHLRIELFVYEDGLAEPLADEVGDDERRDAQAEHELERLDSLPAKLPAFVERPDSEARVDQCCGIKHDRDREKLPEPGVVIDTGGKGIHRNVAERVVEKMAHQIGEQHQPAAETYLADADAADELCDLFLRE